MEVIWRIKTSDELETIYKYIKKEIPKNAILVFNSICDLAISLPNFPYRFPLEPIINIEKVRYVVIWSFKIIYAVKEQISVILRVFNTKQNPKKLKK